MLTAPDSPFGLTSAVDFGSCYDGPMGATIINESGEPDVMGEFKTYDVVIDHGGVRYWKLGTTARSLARRFVREPGTTLITIRQIWRHESLLRAESHERGLFRRYKGDRPYIGKMGPLVGGGNTEVFSHDAVSGEEGPKTFKAVVIDPTGWRDTRQCYLDFDPYSRWPTQYGWVPSMLGPDFDAVLISEKSDSEKITVCSIELLERMIENRGLTSPIPRSVAERALAANRWVTNYADTYRTVPGVFTGWLPSNSIMR